MRKRNGFTLIELLIVMALSVFLAAAAIGAMGNTQRTMSFLDTNEKVLSLIRNARTNAITGRAVTDATDYDKDIDTSDQVTPANYGIYFSQSSAIGPIDNLILFADMHSDTAGEEGVFDPKDLTISTLKINSDISITLIPSTTNTILFSPIIADTTLYPSLPSNTQYFMFKIYQASTMAAKCYIIHPAAGNPEPYACPST